MMIYRKIRTNSSKALQTIIKKLSLYIIESWYKTKIPYLTSVLKGITTIHPYLEELYT
jgi:hypothetical protein